MTFDAALKRVFDAAVEELTALAAEERNRAREQGTDDGRVQGLKDGREQGRVEGHKEGHDEGRALGVKEGRDQGREEAAREGQIALDAAVAAARAKATVSIAANTRLLDAIRAIDAAQTLGDVLDELTEAAAAEAGRAGVLLAQNGRLRGYKFQGFGQSFADPSSINLEPGNVHSLAEGREGVEAPLVLFGETVAILYADSSAGQGATAASTTWRDTLEILSRHAARALEALTAIKTARAVAGVQTPSAHAPVDEREEADSSARRYAKLLVSEIKLYHEAAVVAGRRDRDLATRLGGEISRARVLYEQRVPAAIRERADYFRDELVRTLANGDATLLRLS